MSNVDTYANRKTNKLLTGDLMVEDTVAIEGEGKLEPNMSWVVTERHAG